MMNEKKVSEVSGGEPNLTEDKMLAAITIWSTKNTGPEHIKKGVKFMCVSVINGFSKAVKLFIENGISANSQHYPEGLDPKVPGFTPLFYAAKYGQESVVKYLCENGAEINTRCGGTISPLFHKIYDWMSPLFIATANKHEKVVRYLCEQGAHVNSHDRHVPFYNAVLNDDFKVVNCLLEYGANIPKALNLLKEWGPREPSPAMYKLLKLGWNSKIQWGFDDEDPACYVNLASMIQSYKSSIYIRRLERWLETKNAYVQSKKLVIRELLLPELVYFKIVGYLDLSFSLSENRVLSIGDIKDSNMEIASPQIAQHLVLQFDVNDMRKLLNIVEDIDGSPVLAGIL